MGTDVEFWIERRVADGWQWVEPAEESFFSTYGRPYRLFSLLLGRPVGLFSDTQDLPSITPPRGIPSDRSPEAERRFLEWGIEEMWSPSWIMAEEALRYDWDQELRLTAWAYTAQVGAHRESDGAVDLGDREYVPVAFGREEGLAAVMAETDPPWVVFNCFVIHGRPNRAPDPVPDWVTPVYHSLTVREYVGCAEEFVESIRALGPPDEIRLTFFADQ